MQSNPGAKVNEEKPTDLPQASSQNKSASADFSFQFSAAREHQKVEKRIFSFLCEISRDFLKKKETIGVLVVLGVFDTAKGHIISGMRQIGVNPIQKYMDVSAPAFRDDIRHLLESGYDGAVIVNRNGQVIGNRIYLIVENPALEVPEGCGTRHISAASFSTRTDVMAVFTLSEETSVVRTWKEGVFVDQYHPKDDDEEDVK
jgi:DNA integrity scanning protein DisA with diadenylate cyclase activity